MTKTILYRMEVLADDLHQYVSYDEATQDTVKGKIRPVIKLDDGPKENKSDYKPPTNLTIKISKIPMPELQPRAANALHEPPGKVTSPLITSLAGYKGSCRRLGIQVTIFMHLAMP